MKKIIDNYVGVLKNYTKFDGRASRSEYWYFVLVNLIVSIVLGIVGGALKTELLSNLYSLATLVPALAVAVRRRQLLRAVRRGVGLLVPALLTRAHPLHCFSAFPASNSTSITDPWP
jgi:uncharacterized membrane protein YhaH (DUF805 family)